MAEGLIEQLSHCAQCGADISLSDHHMQSRDHAGLGKVICRSCWESKSRVCDFCADSNWEWEFLVKQFPYLVTMEVNKQGGLDTVTEESTGNWLACTRCKELVETNDWDRLLKIAISPHSNSSVVDKHYAQLAAMIRNFHGLFRRYRVAKPPIRVFKLGT